jgi:hypothetical protein
MAHIDTAVSGRTRRRAGPLVRKPTRQSKINTPAEHFIDPASLPKKIYALRVVGDCMAPIVKEGEHVLVDPITTPKTGDLVIIYLKKGDHWQGGTNAGLKRVVFNMMAGIKFPYVAHPDSNVIPILIVEDNRHRQYTLRADMLLGVHKCLGAAPKGTNLKRAD